MWKILKFLALAVSEIFPHDCFCNGELCDGSVNAVCSRPEVADDVISGEDAETVQEYVCIYLCVASVVCVKIEISHLCDAQTTVGRFERHFRGQGAKNV